MARPMTEPLEITDVIIDYDPATLERRPVTKRDVLERLRSSGADRFALSIAADLPEREGIIDPDAVDRIMIEAHAEMQRLWETFLHGRRAGMVLKALVNAARQSGTGGPLRIVDVGCGCGYVIRWLAAHRVFDDSVELVGADYNRALVNEAQQLAEAENLRCRFVVANAFQLEEPAAFYLSTGVIHHFRGEGLVSFFREQGQSRPLGFVHFDVQKSWAAPLGSWLFHKAKMRLRIGQYDGHMSALRAHPTEALLTAARRGASELRIAQFNRQIPWFPIIRTMHAVIGLRPQMEKPFLAALGPIAGSMEPFS
jgi:SAM-dependent methyltransferase